MAFTDNTTGGRIILSAEGPVKVTLASGVTVKPGDLIGYSGGWKKADANAEIYAELIAGMAGTAEEITAYRKAEIDGFSGATAGDLVYLSDTAGEYSATAGTIQQVVGRATAATRALIEPAAQLNAVGLQQIGKTVLPNTVKKTTVSADKTLAIVDCGDIQVVDTDAKTITLPSTAAGLHFTVMNGGADGAVLVKIDPAAADKISGALATPVDNKDLLNTKATARKGDYVKLLGDGVDGWVITELVGTWAREA